VNFKTTLILLVVLIAAAGAFLLLDPSPPSEPVDASAVGEPIVTGRDFLRIVIERDGVVTSLRQEDGGWWQTLPVRFPVTGQAIEQLINAGLSLSPRQTFFDDKQNHGGDAAPPARDQLGLDPPQATVTFISDTGTHTLLLGSTNVAGTAYLQRDGEAKVHLVDATLHQAVFNADPRNCPPSRPSG